MVEVKKLVISGGPVSGACQKIVSWGGFGLGL